MTPQEEIKDLEKKIEKESSRINGMGALGMLGIGRGVIDRYHKRIKQLKKRNK